MKKNVNVTVNANAVGNFVTAISLYDQEYKNLMHKVRLCELHQEFLAGKIYGSWKMDLAASDYRLSHSQLDLLIEQRKAGLAILAFNRTAKMDPAIQETFLSRVYAIKDIPGKDASDEEIATFCKDVRELLSDFGDLNDLASETLRSGSAE